MAGNGKTHTHTHTHTQSLQSRFAAQKAYLQNFKKFKEISGKYTGPKAEKGEDRGSNRTRQNNKKASRKLESNDSPKIPGRGRHQNRPACLRANTNQNRRSFN